MLILGVDASTVSTGVCLLDTEKNTIKLSAFGRTSNVNTRFSRLNHSSQIVEQILDFCVKNKFSDSESRKIVFEEIAVFGSVNTSVALAFLVGFLSGTLRKSLSSDIEYVYSQTWKRYLIGHRTSGKELIEEGFMSKVEEFGFKVSSDVEPSSRSYQDALDAFGVAFYGAYASVEDIKTSKEDGGLFSNSIALATHGVNVESSKGRRKNRKRKN